MRIFSLLLLLLLTSCEKEVIEPAKKLFHQDTLTIEKRNPRRFRPRLKKKKDEKTRPNSNRHRNWFYYSGSRSHRRNLPNSI
jgi:hypothetical protein